MDAGIEAFLQAVEPGRQAEARRLVTIYAEETGFAPAVWGSILGFGRYDYRYDSGRTGTSLAAGFAPRKAEIVLYNMPGDEAALAGLGQVRRGKGCVYLRRLAGVDEAALRAAIRAGLAELAGRWTLRP